MALFWCRPVALYDMEIAPWPSSQQARAAFRHEDADSGLDRMWIVEALLPPGGQAGQVVLGDVADANAKGWAVPGNGERGHRGHRVFVWVTDLRTTPDLGGAHACRVAVLDYVCVGHTIVSNAIRASLCPY